MGKEKPKINLIWLAQADWEHDWVTKVLCKDVEFSREAPPVFVVNSPDGEIPMKAKSFGVIHLSDEAYTHNIKYYPDAAFVFRNYYSKTYATMPNVYFFPLGYKKGYNDEKHLLHDNRCYTWSFAGQIAGKPTRESMLNGMVEVDDESARIHVTTQWDDPNSLTTTEYRDLMNKTLLAPCPAGWCNPDSFRVCEALEAGAIPIVDNRAYFEKLFGGDVPFLSVKSDWTTVEVEIENNAKDLKQIQTKCIFWWDMQKDIMASDFAQACKRL